MRLVMGRLANFLDNKKHMYSRDRAEIVGYYAPSLNG
jgi:hypothetical protein